MSKKPQILIHSESKKDKTEAIDNLPKRERWLFCNKVALKKIEQGLRDSKARRIKYKGSFIQYQNEE